MCSLELLVLFFQREKNKYFIKKLTKKSFLSKSKHLLLLGVISDSYKNYMVLASENSSLLKAHLNFQISEFYSRFAPLYMYTIVY
jgi:hypothetical protein